VQNVVASFDKALPLFLGTTLSKDWKAQPLYRKFISVSDKFKILSIPGIAFIHCMFEIYSCRKFSEQVYSSP
jgi:hypothetical protein